MKNVKQYLLAIVALFLITSCGSDDPSTPTAQAEAFEKLSGSWTLGATGSITVDGQDVSLNYPGFTLSFTDGGYRTTNAGDLFSATGTWSWVDDSANRITLGTGEEVTIISLTETRFQFSFSFDGAIATGIAGNYTITVEK